MTSSVPEMPLLKVRPLQYRDTEAIINLIAKSEGKDISQRLTSIDRDLQQVRSWYGIGKFLRIFPYSSKTDRRVYVADREHTILGLILVAPFNSTHTTWKVERILIDENVGTSCTKKTIGSQLLRYCLENIWEARSWILEVNIHNKQDLGIYRESGFQPLAQMTYWRIEKELISKLAQQEPELPNLLPVSNADAPLLYQLDCMSMPPLLRQIFDRHIQDFKTSFVETAMEKILQWLAKREKIQGYIFEPQRKAAIAYFQLKLSYHQSEAYQAKLTVNPAYTWLYPESIVQMAKTAYEFSTKTVSESPDGILPCLDLVSADYQPEREEYLAKIGATPVEETLLMSRSVWHKIREAKPLEGLQLKGVLQGLTPVRTPIPSRISWLQLMSERHKKDRDNQMIIEQKDSNSNNGNSSSSKTPDTGDRV